MKTEQEIKDRIESLAHVWDNLRPYVESSDMVKGVIGGKLASLEWVIGMRDDEV